MQVKVVWQDGLCFLGLPPSGHAVVMDGARDVGGEDSGPRPTELLLIALGGCTGMDVVSILQKMRTPPRKFWIEIDAERNEQHPKAIRRVHLTYIAEGVPEENLRRAAELSQERYCSVAHSLSAELTFSVRASP